ncbi:MAG: hypothetical protein ACYS1A_10640 [Planctomycetota bacterium]|jgi:hypothetical protein
MIAKLSQRDKRALKLGTVSVAAILVFVFMTTWLEHWARVRESLAVAKVDLKIISPTKARQEGLLTIVPVFEMPQKQEEQKFLFRNKFNEQLKKAGIKSGPVQFTAGKSLRQGGYRLLRLKCSTKCKFNQVLDLLANLKNNPYLVGIEQLNIKCDPKKRQEVELDLTVSTFAK